MATPLVMLGSGGDYVTRWEPHGTSILKRVGQTEAQPDEPDTDSASSNAGGGGGGRLRQRRGQVQVTRTSGGRVDTWEPASGDEADRIDTRAQRQWVRAGTLSAAAGAISVWMTQQQRALAQATLNVLAFAQPDPVSERPRDEPAVAAAMAGQRHAGSAEPLR